MQTNDRREFLGFWWEEMKDWAAGWMREGGFWRWVGRAAGVGFIGVWMWMIWVKLGVSGAIGGDSAAVMGAGLGWGLAAFGCLVLGAVLLAPSLVQWVAWPFFRFIDSVYLGTHRIERPPLNYDTAERLLRERRWQDAGAEFERIAYWHPEEERAWREAIRCAELSEDAGEAARLRRRARQRCPAVRG
jgi:hypothetical protein